MAMSAGSCTVASDGTVTKSGLAEAIYDEFFDNHESDTGSAMPGDPEAVEVKKGYATISRNVSTALVTYFTANMQAKITNADSGLQKIPNPVVPGNDADAPGGDKFIAIV